MIDFMVNVVLFVSYLAAIVFLLLVISGMISLIVQVWCGIARQIRSERDW